MTPAPTTSGTRTRPTARRAAPSLALALLLGAGACAESTADPTQPAPIDVTWSEHVAPIVYENCVGCHREGAIAPFPLVTYQDAAPIAEVLALVTAERIMPPMGVDNSGDCHTFRDARWLEDDEIAVFAAWAANGAPEGDPALAPELPPPPPGLARVDAVLEMEESYAPREDRDDDYRCFVVDLGPAAGRWLEGYEVVPGEPRVVHHVIVYSLPTAAAAASAEALDAAEPGPGYTCYGASNVSPSDPIALWAPGTGPVEFPPGTGVQLGGDQAIVQIHYNTSAGALPDRTLVRLELADRVDIPAQFVLAPNFSLNLPPREARVESTSRITLPIGGTIWGAIPHMHELGTELRATLTPAGSSAPECLVDVFDWDFQWQGLWFYDTPIAVRAGDRLDLTCVYDTRSRADVTRWGEGTEDEMCLVYLFASR